MIAREGRSRPGARTGRLLERERELETLAAAITAAGDGTAGLVLVEGPAGIGKSRLLVEARMLAEERELCVRSARGGELELDFPFGVVRQLFESQLVDESERSRLLSGAASAAAPVFGHDGARGTGEPSGEGHEAQMPLVHPDAEEVSAGAEGVALEAHDSAEPAWHRRHLCGGHRHLCFRRRQGFASGEEEACT